MPYTGWKAIIRFEMNARLHMVQVAVLLPAFLSAAHAREVPLSTMDLGEATLASPRVVVEGGAGSFDPAWAGDRLLTDPVSDLALGRFERHGRPVWDPSSGAWYVWANGAIVRLDGSRAVVVVDGVQGRDLDVRAARGVAVSREPDHAIVVWSLDGRSEPRRLACGANYFHPRLSPDGTSVLVQEARSGGGRLLLVSMDGRARDLGPGSDGAFTPDGRGVVFTVVSGDGHRVAGADLVHLDLASGRRTRLTWTSHAAEVEPAISPDGRFLAFVDALAGTVCVARMPALPGGGGGP